MLLFLFKETTVIESQNQARQINKMKFNEHLDVKNDKIVSSIG